MGEPTIRHRALGHSRPEQDRARPPGRRAPTSRGHHLRHECRTRTKPQTHTPVPERPVALSLRCAPVMLSGIIVPRVRASESEGSDPGVE